MFASFSLKVMIVSSSALSMLLSMTDRPGARRRGICDLGRYAGRRSASSPPTTPGMRRSSGSSLIRRGERDYHRLESYLEDQLSHVFKIGLTGGTRK